MRFLDCTLQALAWARSFIRMSSLPCRSPIGPLMVSLRYSNCVQVNVTGGGSKTLPSGIALPGAYDPDDTDGILLDLWKVEQKLIDYVIPGGDVVLPCVRFVFEKILSSDVIYFQWRNRRLGLREVRWLCMNVLNIIGITHVHKIRGQLEFIFKLGIKPANADVSRTPTSNSEHTMQAQKKALRELVSLRLSKLRNIEEQCGRATCCRILGGN